MERMDEILPYLERFGVDDAPDDTRRLSYPTPSLAEITPAVELFHEPTISYGYDGGRFEPGPE
jgi:hypothetical protein